MKETNHKLSEKIVGATISRPHFKEKAKGKNGITLIALIITIILMMILVGVTVTVAINGGVFNKTKEARIKYEIALIQDLVDVEKLNLQAERVENDQDMNVPAKEIAILLGEQSPQEITIGQNPNYVSNDKQEPNGKAYIIRPSTVGLETERGKGQVNADGTITDVFIICDNNKKVYYIKSAAVQGKQPEGFVWKEVDEGEIPEYDIAKIYAIEDLVKLSELVNAGTFEEEYRKVYGEEAEIVVTLERTLDFTNSASYRNAQDTSYGDINGIEDDGNAIMIEMTTGLGFKPIGVVTGFDDMPTGNSFKGTFDGNNNTIYNLYINRPEEMMLGLFGMIDSGTTIQNLGVTGEVIGNESYAAGIIGFVSGMTNETEINIRNCHVSNLKVKSLVTGGIIAAMASVGDINIEGCTTSEDTIIGLESKENMFGAGIAVSMGCSKITINNCINKAKIYGQLTAGIISNPSESEGQTHLDSCENYGELNGETVVGIAYAEQVYLNNCINYANLEATDEVYGVAAGVVYAEGCINNGNLTSNGSRLVGVLESTNSDTETEIKILNCTNNGELIYNGDSSYSDIAGVILSKADNTVISNCVNNGLIKATTTCGSVAGICCVGSSADEKLEITGCTNNGSIIAEKKIKNLAGILTNDDRGNIEIKESNNYGEINYIMPDDTNSYVRDYISGCVASHDEYNYSEEIYISNCNNYAFINVSSKGRVDVAGIAAGEVISANACNNEGKIEVHAIGGEINGIGSGSVKDSNNKESITAYNIEEVYGITYDSIENCTNTGDITVFTDSSSEVKGLGRNAINCTNYGNLKIDIGENNSGSASRISGIGSYAENCVNLGEISIVGSTQEDLYFKALGIGGSATNCINKGKVINMLYYASGIGSGSPLNCCNYGEIIGKKAAGICWHSDNARNCFNAGKIVGTEEAAGIMSKYNDSYLRVNNCYNVGTLEADSGITYDITDKEEKIINCHALTGNEDATAKQALLNALNTNREDTATWSEWKIVEGVNNGYPIFVWENVE